MLIASERKASELGLEPRARFVSFGLAGVDPYRMLHGNPQASEAALKRAGIGWDDVSVIEVNEAFASVVLQFARDAGLEERMDDVNPNGGGISLGHPLGATGARITATLINELERRDARLRPRDDVHRLRPGDRRGHRTGVRRVELTGEREVTAPGSMSARVRRLAAQGARRRDRDRSGRRRRQHPAAVAQLFVVVSGSGWVSGADGEREAIVAGQAVLWEPGEEHESGSDEGMTALVVEAESLAV